MFHCDQCGLCCRHIDKVPELKAFHNGDGVCKYLTEDNRCSIYPVRPTICNVDLMYEKVYRHAMTREEFDDLNTASCNMLKAGKI